MRGRRIRGRGVSAVNIKISYERPEHIRHDFEYEITHLAWGAGV